jgi:hypothetical protein
MNTRKIKTILIEEIEYKKVFAASWDTRCDECGKDILEGEDFVFMGSKKKICEDCRGDIISFLEEE